jgi:hypothetical protein
MRTLLGFFAVAAFSALALLYVIATVLIQLLPLLVIAAIAIAGWQAMTRLSRAHSASASRPPPRPHLAAPQGHWVFLPVWVSTAPRPVRSYRDAAVIEVRSG